MKFIIYCLVFVVLFVIALTIDNKNLVKAEDPFSNPIVSTRDLLTLGDSNKAIVHVDVYIDLGCSDTSLWWKSVWKGLNSFYFNNQTSNNNLLITYHHLPLPYHVASYALTEAFVIVNKYDKGNKDITYSLMNDIYLNQDAIYNNIVSKLNLSQMQSLIYDSYIAKLNIMGKNQFINEMNDVTNDLRVRTLFKESCARGVSGTPTFFVNGVQIYNGGDLSTQDWINLINKLVQKQ